MADRLRGASSPYLLAHADNPVDWWPWGAEAFAEAGRRDVPVLISIGYATCHWCHVMARESFGDPELAARLNRSFVAIKVDREEHPDVDAAYLAAAGAFTPQLGWPLTVFASPDGGAFYAGTYYPPEPRGGVPSFAQVLDAVREAWTERRDEVAATETAIRGALASARNAVRTEAALPDAGRLERAAEAVLREEDPQHAGFGGAPKFPAPPLLDFLGAHGGDARAAATRELRAIAASGLRDPVEGGFFRYATRADWSEPHYERMLTDNAQLLARYTELAADGAGDAEARAVAAGIADFLIEVLGLPGGGFASAQDSESVLDGRRDEGGYYRLDRAARAGVEPPPLDRKLVTGWNGLAIGALAEAGARLGEARWIAAARAAADRVLEAHLGADGALTRASLDGRVSSAPATLEDVGMLAGGLLRLALALGEPSFAVTARTLVDGVLDAEAGFRIAGDPVLRGLGLDAGADAGEESTPSGPSAAADAARLLWALGAGEAYRAAAERALRPLVDAALERPMALPGVLAVCERLARPPVQLVVVMPDEAADAGTSALLEAARAVAADVVVVVDARSAARWDAAGFELFTGRRAGDGALAYLCRDFVCRLPVGDAEALRELAAG